MGKRTMKLKFGQKDYIFLDNQETMTLLTLLKAMRIIHKQGYRYYSTTRLLKTAFKYRSSDYVSENRLRRMIAYCIASKPKYIHIKQKGNLRLISPTDLTLSLWSENTSNSKESSDSLKIDST